MDLKLALEKLPLQFPTQSSIVDRSIHACSSKNVYKNVYFITKFNVLITIHKVSSILLVVGQGTTFSAITSSSVRFLMLLTLLFSFIYDGFIREMP